MRIKNLILPYMVLLLLSSCIGGETQVRNLPQVIDTATILTPIFTNSLTLQPISSPTSSLPATTRQIINFTATPIPTGTPNPTPTFVDTYPLPPSSYAYKGKIFIDIGGEGKYIITDLDNHKVIFSEIPSKDFCRLYRGDQNICQEENDGRLYIYMWKMKGKIYLPIPNPYTWFLTNDEKKLYYCIKTGDNQCSFYSYDIETVKIEPLGIINLSDWSDAGLQLSNDGVHLIGVYYVGNNLYQLNEVKGPQVQQITYGDHSVVPSPAWSPTESILGFGIETLKSDVGFNPTVFMIYDAKTGIIKKVADSPGGTIYDFFPGNSMWSPDGKKVALTAGHSICIINIDKKNQDCYKIWSPDESTSEFAWSPDSKAIAFVTQRATNDLLVFFIENQKIDTILTNIGTAHSMIWK